MTTTTPQAAPPQNINTSSEDITSSTPAPDFSPSSNHVSSPPRMPIPALGIDAWVRGDLPALKLLLDTQVSDIDAVNPDGRTVLMEACAQGHLPIVKFLIDEREASVTLRNASGATLLHIACLNSLDVVKYVASKGVDVNARDKNGGHCIMYACDRGRLPIVRYLVSEHHVDPNIVDNEGWNCLIFACQDGHLGIIRYLSEEARADVHLKAKDGTNCLMRACVDDHLPIVRYLVEEQQSSPKDKSSKGESCLALAALAENQSIVEYLVIEHGMKPSKSLIKNTKVPATVRQFLNECTPEFVSVQRLKKLQETKKAIRNRLDPTFFDEAPVFSLQLCVNDKRAPIYADMLYALKFILVTESWTILQRSIWINHVKKCVAGHNRQWLDHVKNPSLNPAPTVFSGKVPPIEASDAKLWFQPAFRDDLDVNWFLLVNASPNAPQVSKNAFTHLTSEDFNPSGRFHKDMTDQRVIEKVFYNSRFDLRSPHNVFQSANMDNAITTTTPNKQGVKREREENDQSESAERAKRRKTEELAEPATA
eukprot:CAMPEP_0117445794 /NCGR_PEP_ID=MMETSP0759-20121206/5987_1 /TAXON_ID=63605 /ORGANISM="Percolomonas cosmopolitus, Strain WS" /LENGTH=536 /DNA_ID=CAMNT_0005237997 /DNA_START=95 /DNA_END=1705 /DNA_ORIENTATION=-